MRCLTIGNFGRSWDGSICDEEHIASALEELGHEVIRWSRDYGNTVPPFIPQDYEADWVLIAQYDNYGDKLVDILRKYTRGPIVYWAFDYQADGQEWHERLVEESDLYLSKRIADSKYPNWQWLSQDFAPKFLDKHPAPVEKDIDVLFTGSYLDWAAERNETIKAVNEKFNLVVHSVNDWPFLESHPPIMDEGLPELYARAKVILSIDHTIEAGYWSDRNAQIICCRERPLFRYVPLSEARFGQQVDYFYDIPDCLTKIQQRLDRPRYDEPYADNMRAIDRVRDLLTILGGAL